LRNINIEVANSLSVAGDGQPVIFAAILLTSIKSQSSGSSTMEGRNFANLLTYVQEMPMKRIHIFTRRAYFCCCLFGVGLPGHAVELGVTPSGIRFASGGVDHSKLLSLNDEKNCDRFGPTTAFRGSGSYLATVWVRIFDATTRKPVLAQRMDGPWLFAALPAGRYDVEASYSEVLGCVAQLRKKTTTIHKNDRHQMVPYCDTQDTLSKDGEPAFKFNPYSDKWCRA
jgi:hypothetical protein